MADRNMVEKVAREGEADGWPPEHVALARQAVQGRALAAVEEAINEALIIFGFDAPAIRRALLTARGDLREAAGEGRT